MNNNMKTLSKIFGVSFLMFFGWEFSYAQANNNAGNNNAPSVIMPRDGAYPPEDYSHRRVVPPPYMRYADVMWKERIWRVIDTKQKINEQLYYPVIPNANRISLFDLIKQSLISGEIKAYDFNPADNDAIMPPLTLTEVKNKLSSTDTVTDENGNPRVVVNNVTADKVRGYLLKEDWHFDKQRSVLDPRILWICPRIVTINKNTNEEDLDAGPTSLFWLYFNDLRPMMAKTPVFNAKNDAAWLSFDDIFWNRQFSSYIIQVSNVFNRSISVYAKGLDALAESNKAEANIADLEGDMWQY